MDTTVEFSFNECDALSEIPTMHLSYFIQAFLPIRLIEWKKVRRHYDSIVSSMQRCASDASGDTFVVTGSMAEGYAVPNSITRTNPPRIEKHSDIDVLWVNGSMHISTTELSKRNDTEFKGYLEYDNLHPGYTRICLPSHKQDDEAFIFDEEKNKYYLSSTIFMDRLLSTLPHLALEKSEEAWIQGPALTIVDNREVSPENMNEPNIGGSSDLVMALTCSPWPEIANDWKIRAGKSEWLEPQFVDEIIADGCHVVAVPSKVTAKQELEWRISFSSSEGKLAREAVTDYQRQCYVYLKMLRNQIKKPESAMSSYVFKSVFLHCCEKLPVNYWKDYPGNCVLFMLDSILECLRKKNVPTYFLPENNLIDHLSETELQAAIVEVQTLRLDPITPILDFTDDRVFGYHSVIATFREMMKPLLDDMKMFTQHRNKTTSLMSGIIGTGYNICYLLLHEHVSNREAETAKHQEAIRCLIDIYTLWLRPMCLNATLMQFINSAGLAIKDLHISCRYFEAVVSLSTEYPEFTSVGGNLACMYHSLAYSHPDGSAGRSDYLRKAGDMFKDVYNKTKSSDIDYVTYLVKQNKFEFAKQILEDLISDVDGNENTEIGYDIKEQETLDDPLRKHVQEFGKISGDSVSFAYFYSIKCICSLGKCDQTRSQIKTILEKFELHCKTMKTDNATLLFGYAQSLSNVVR